VLVPGHLEVEGVLVLPLEKCFDLDDRKMPLPANDRRLFQARAQIACLRHAIFFDRKLSVSLPDSPNMVS
jgi:hypothetical protein